MSVHISFELAGWTGDVESRLQTWDGAEFAARLWAKDPTLWADEPQPELVDRLGWLGLATRMAGHLEQLESFGAEVAAAGFRHVVVLGMGGSSLAPEVYQATFGNAPGYPELLVLDSTHPGSVVAIADSIDLERDAVHRLVQVRHDPRDAVVLPLLLGSCRRRSATSRAPTSLQ